MAKPLKTLQDPDPDDYMSMTIIEPVQPPQKETYTQRRIRKEREVSPFSSNQPLIRYTFTLPSGREKIPPIAPVRCSRNCPLNLSSLNI